MGGGGQSASQRLDREISADLPGKKRQEKKGKGVKIDFFFFFLFNSLFKTTKICFGSTRMEIFYWEKSISCWEKIRKNDFALSEKFSCYAPVPMSLELWDGNPLLFSK